MALAKKSFFFFFFNDTATTEIYTLSLHDALPIWYPYSRHSSIRRGAWRADDSEKLRRRLRSEGTRLNSSHMSISYAVFCLKKKKKKDCRFYRIKKQIIIYIIIYK